MNYNRYLKRTLGVLAAAIMFSTASSHAALTYHVDITTGSLGASASAPFSLDFQLNGSQGNTAIISNLTFGGGAATPGTNTFGQAAGSLGSSVTLGSTSLADFFNEFYQGFTSGSVLGFDVTLTDNFSSGTPDAFSVAILDKDIFNIPTNGLGDSLLLINLDNTPSAETYAGTGDFAGLTVTAAPVASSPVPDSGTTLGLLGFTLAGMHCLRRKLMAA
jgi:hypothetical protein